MANIFCVWEMGSNLGHLTNFKYFVDLALQRGHKVSLAVKEIQNVPLIFQLKDIDLYQAPYIIEKSARASRPIHSYTQLVLKRMENVQQLSTLCAGWNSLFKAVKPDLVIYDFAPSALISSIDKKWVKWLVGSGFLIPRTDQNVLGPFPGSEKDEKVMRLLGQEDDLLLEIINSSLENNNSRGIKSLGEIIDQVDKKLFLTLQELDHFGDRPGENYLGVPTLRGGERPRWPEKGKYKVFGYLKNFPGIEKLLSNLVRKDVSLIIYSRNIPQGLKNKFDSIMFVDLPQDISCIKKEADLVISMGGHSTVTECVLNNIPQILIPEFQEQFFFSKRVESLGLGVILKKGAIEENINRAFDLVKTGKKVFTQQYAKKMTGPLLKKSIVENLQKFEEGLSLSGER